MKWRGSRGLFGCLIVITRIFKWKRKGEEKIREEDITIGCQGDTMTPLTFAGFED